jgi:hypothetical protein
VPGFFLAITAAVCDALLAFGAGIILLVWLFDFEIVCYVALEVFRRLKRLRGAHAADDQSRRGRPRC